MPTKLTEMLSAHNETTANPCSEWLKTDISLMLQERGSPPVPATMSSSFPPFGTDVACRSRGY